MVDSGSSELPFNASKSGAGGAMGLGQQALTLVGVALGGFVSILGVVLTERLRSRRDRHTDWDDRMFDACREFSHSISRYVFASRRLAVTSGLMEGPSPAQPEQVAESLVLADTGIALAFESLRLLAGEDLAAAARVLRRTAWQLGDYAQGLVQVDPAEWDAAYRRHRQARKEFSAAARSCLKIPAAAAGPVSDWPGSASRPPEVGAAAVLPLPNPKPPNSAVEG